MGSKWGVGLGSRQFWLTTFWYILSLSQFGDTKSVTILNDSAKMGFHESTWDGRNMPRKEAEFCQKKEVGMSAFTVAFTFFISKHYLPNK